jgi:hypothetical protein
LPKMKYLSSILKSVALAVCVCFSVRVSHAQVVFQPTVGTENGKHIVLLAGDDEYFSEEAMPAMARILSQKHGFRCTVLFSTNPETGAINHSEKTNIPGLEALSGADLMVVFTRFRMLKDEQMKHVVDYLDSGRPVMGLRTATHAFAYPAESSSPYAKYSWNNKDAAFEGGFGRHILGETWITHHGGHGKQSTRGIVSKIVAGHPVLRGIRDGDIFGPTDVYGVRLPLPEGSLPLVFGQVLSGMESADPAAAPALDVKSGVVVDKNSPMMPVAWVRTYKGSSGKEGRVFTTTMGGAMSGKRDWDSEGFRRLFVNAAYWCVGLESKISADSDVTLLASPGAFKRGAIPAEALKAETAQ